MNFIKILKYGENKIFCICIDVYKKHKGNNYDKIYEVSSELKNKKLKTNNILIKIIKRYEWKSGFRTKLTFKNSNRYI